MGKEEGKMKFMGYISLFRNILYLPEKSPCNKFILGNWLQLYKISTNPINVIWTDIICEYNSNISERCDITAVSIISRSKKKKKKKRWNERSLVAIFRKWIPHLVSASGFEWLSIKPEIRNDFYDWSAGSTINRLVNLIEQILECISGEFSRKDCTIVSPLSLLSRFFHHKCRDRNVKAHGCSLRIIVGNARCL